MRRIIGLRRHHAAQSSRSRRSAVCITGTRVVPRSPPRVHTSVHCGDRSMFGHRIGHAIVRAAPEAHHRLRLCVAFVNFDVEACGGSFVQLTCATDCGRLVWTSFFGEPQPSNY